MRRDKFLLSILSPPTYILDLKKYSRVLSMEYVSNVSRYISRSWTVHAAIGAGVLVSMTSETVNVIGEKTRAR